MPHDERKVDKIRPQTGAALIRAFMTSDDFLRLPIEKRKDINRYLKVAEHPAVLGARNIVELRPKLTQGFLDSYADRPGAQRHAKNAIRHLEKWAMFNDYLPFPILQGVELVPLKGGHKPWTDAQIAMAERCSPPHVSRIVTLASNTGQRGSDLCRMRWSDLEKVEGHPGINVKQRKTGLELWIPFTAELIAAMETWERRPGFILLKPDGTPFNSRREVYNAWIGERGRNPQLAACAGLVPHGMRAAAVIRLRRAGATIPQIADMVGMHVKTVEVYCRFADQKTSAIAAVHHLNRTSGERSGLFGQNKPTKVGG